MNGYTLNEVHGGLGDALAFSTLPERFALDLGADTYIHNFYKPRNPEILDFVWGLNPFVRGWSSSVPTAGSVRKLGTPGSLTFIENIEVHHQLEPKNLRPKIYYRPLQIPAFSGLKLIDLTSITVQAGRFALSPTSIAKFLDNRLEQEENQNYVLVTYPSFPLNSELVSLSKHLAQLEAVEILGLPQLADAIFSSIGLIGLHSGAVALASAVRGYKPDLDIECLISPYLAAHPRQRVEKIHSYPDVRYTSVP